MASFYKKVPKEVVVDLPTKTFEGEIVSFPGFPICMERSRKESLRIKLCRYLRCLWRCPEDMTVGVAAIGYGDGYPRHARTGTAVSINGQRSQLLGRVSMDAISIDLRGINAQCGDLVELWGKDVSVDEVATSSDTIAYELLCNTAACRLE